MSERKIDIAYNQCVSGRNCESCPFCNDQVMCKRLQCLIIESEWLQEVKAMCERIEHGQGKYLDRGIKEISEHLPKAWKYHDELREINAP